jgi:hypothetical protein
LLQLPFISRTQLDQAEAFKELWHSDSESSPEVILKRRGLYFVDPIRLITDTDLAKTYSARILKQGTFDEMLDMPMSEEQRERGISFSITRCWLRLKVFEFFKDSASYTEADRLFSDALALTGFVCLVDCISIEEAITNQPLCDFIKTAGKFIFARPPSENPREYDAILVELLELRSEEEGSVNTLYRYAHHQHLTEFLTCFTETTRDLFLTGERAEREDVVMIQ